MITLKQQFAARAAIRRLGRGPVSRPRVPPAHPRTARGVRRGPGTQERLGASYAARYRPRLDEATGVGKASSLEAWLDP